MRTSVPLAGALGKAGDYGLAQGPAVVLPLVVMGSRDSELQPSLFSTLGEQCSYCGRHGPTTADHTPPKALLRRPLPSNLKTVRACRACNESFSFDEETVQALVTLIGTHPELQASRSEGGRLHRALARSPKLRTVFDRSLQPDGNYLLTEELLSSVERVACKTAQGLYHGFYNRFVGRESLQLLAVEDAKRVSVEDLVLRLRPSPLEEIDLDQPMSEISPASWHSRQPVVAVKLAPVGGGLPVERLFRLKQATPVEWIDLQKGIFRFAFVGQESGDAACILEIWESLIIAVGVPWPNERGGMRKGRNNPLSRERRQTE